MNRAKRWYTVVSLIYDLCYWPWRGENGSSRPILFATIKNYKNKKFQKMDHFTAQKIAFSLLELDNGLQIAKAP